MQSSNRPTVFFLSPNRAGLISRSLQLVIDPLGVHSFAQLSFVLDKCQLVWLKMKEQTVNFIRTYHTNATSKKGGGGDPRFLRVHLSWNECHLLSSPVGPSAALRTAFIRRPVTGVRVLYACILGRHCSLFDTLGSAFNAPMSCTRARVRARRRQVSVDCQPDLVLRERPLEHAPLSTFPSSFGSLTPPLYRPAC